MKLTYSVSREDYKKLIEYMLKEQARSLRSRIMGFLSTWGLLLLVAFLVVNNPLTLKQKIILTAAAILAAGVNYFTSRTYRWKAGTMFEQMEKKGQIHPSFWQEHSLEPQEKGLMMIYGETEYLLPWQQLKEPELDENFLYIKNMQNSVVEGIPMPVFTDITAQDFIQCCHQLKHSL